MKKDKEWLKEQINYLKEAVGKPAINDFSRGLNDAYDTLESLIEQLDEPELPVIPQFVADWIEHIKENKTWLTLSGAFNHSTQQAVGKTKDWILIGNSDLFARAWLDGYKIEKEPTWTVKLDKGRFVDNFIESITGVEVELSHRLCCTAPIRFKDKAKAEAVALLVNGEVVEVTDNV